MYPEFSSAEIIPTPCEEQSRLGSIPKAQEELSSLELLLFIYNPILECLVSHLPTIDKISFTQTSRTLRYLLYNYSPFFAHLDFRLRVVETANHDEYPLGTVYNLDRLLQSLPIDGRIVSLTLDWTAVSGSFLFSKILDRCQNTLEHLSVRGCRKVSIKHHIVPHFVYQSSISPLGDHANAQTRPALKSLYVYKARGVRRKPFLIDRKPADGDEPSRYLTTLAAQLGIWLDLALCPTPKLRCPRRREILRRGKENFCVPFDRRRSMPSETSHPLSGFQERQLRRAWEELQSQIISCWNCDEPIPDRCEACVHQMTCSHCARPLCHNCSYISRQALGNAVHNAANTPLSASAANMAVTTASSSQWVAMSLLHMTQHQPTDPDDPFEAELSAIRSPLLVPCCRTAPQTHVDNLCPSCFAENDRQKCSLCTRLLCIKHEVERCRKCDVVGGCGRIFCFPSAEERRACGDNETGPARLKDCQRCGKEMCGKCRESTISTSPAPSSGEDDDGASSSSANDQQSTQQRTSCDCKVCQEQYYCPTCWPTKPTTCEDVEDAISLIRAVRLEHGRSGTTRFTGYPLIPL
jgi:hypothetical protein